VAYFAGIEEAVAEVPADAEEPGAGRAVRPGAVAVREGPRERAREAREARCGGERVDEVVAEHARAVLREVAQDVDERVADLTR
jgi:hypothetical protein